MSQDNNQSQLEDNRQYGGMMNDDLNQNQYIGPQDKNKSQNRKINILYLNEYQLACQYTEGSNPPPNDPYYSLQTEYDSIEKEDDEGFLFSKAFERDCPDACIVICNIINQLTKTNVKAIISKNNRFCLKSEVQNDCQHYIMKYKQNLKRIINEFIGENYKKSSDPQRVIEQQQNYHKPNQFNDKDLSDYILSNIGVLRKQIKELNKLM